MTATSSAPSVPLPPSVVRLISPSLLGIELLIAGDLSAAAAELGMVFYGPVWPDDMEMREGLAVHLAATRQNPRDQAWRVFMIVDEFQAAVGHAGFKGGPARGGELEMYWCVEPRWRGRGIAQAAAASLCAWAFAHDVVSAVTATIARHNVPSQRVALALGMQPVGREMKHGLPLWRVRREHWQPPAGALPSVRAV